MEYYNLTKEAPGQDHAPTGKKNEHYSFRSICRCLKTQMGTWSKEKTSAPTLPFLDSMVPGFQPLQAQAQCTKPWLRSVKGWRGGEGERPVFRSDMN